LKVCQILVKSDCLGIKAGNSHFGVGFPMTDIEPVHPKITLQAEDVAADIVIENYN
jgi:hypothetical protein